MEETIRQFTDQTETITNVKNEIKSQLERTFQECHSLQKETETASIERVKSKESSENLQKEAATVKEKCIEIQKTFQNVEIERNNAVAKLKPTESQGRELLQKTLQDYAKSMDEANAKIETIEETLLNVEQAKEKVYKRNT